MFPVEMSFTLLVTMKYYEREDATVRRKTKMEKPKKIYSKVFNRRAHNVMSH